MDVLPASEPNAQKKKRPHQSAIPLYTNERPSKSARKAPTAADGDVHRKKSRPEQEDAEDMEVEGAEVLGIGNNTTPASSRKRRKPEKDPKKTPDQDDFITPQQQQPQEEENEDPDAYTYDQPLHFVDHRVAMDRMAKWSDTTYKNYTRHLSELCQPKSTTYANPEHSQRGFDGDVRLFNLRRDLTGFEDRPIELQMKMHEAAFSIEGPLIYGEEYVLIKKRPLFKTNVLNRFFANKKLILEKNGWQPRLAVLFILTQRKMGKTYFLGQHAVVHAMNPAISDMRIACISRTLDQVRRLRQKKRLGSPTWN